MKHEKMCKEILPLVGGRENISSCYNCMTRLRLVLADVSKADVEALKKVEKVMGVNVVGSQVQIIIGSAASSVCQEFCKIAGLEQQAAVEDEKSAAEDAALAKKESFSIKKIPSIVIDAIANCIQPLLPVIICGGMFKLLCSVLGPAMLGVIGEESNLYVLFTMMGDVPFYFLPVMLGYSAAKYFKVSIPLGLLMGAALIHPTLLNIVTAGEAFTVYGIPMKLVDYSSSVVPTILCVWIMSYVYKFFDKVIPDAFKMLAVNLCTMLVMLPVGLCVLAPIGTVVGNAIGGFLIALPGWIGPFGVALVAFVWPLLVATGMHMPVAMMVLPTFFAEGHEGLILLSDSLQHFSAMGIALAFALMAKGKEDRSLGISSFTSMFLGAVIEPTIYGIALPHKKYLMAFLTGSGIAGFFSACFSVEITNMGASNILNILSFTGSTSHNFIFGCLACLIAFVSAFALSFVFVKIGKKK